MFRTALAVLAAAVAGQAWAADPAMQIASIKFTGGGPGGADKTVLVSNDGTSLVAPTSCQGKGFVVKGSFANPNDDPVGFKSDVWWANDLPEGSGGVVDTDLAQGTFLAPFEATYAGTTTNTLSSAGESRVKVSWVKVVTVPITDENPNGLGLQVVCYSEISVTFAD